jgi:FeS assembly SUF system regulator
MVIPDCFGTVYLSLRGKYGMLRVTKLADYGIVLLTYFASHGEKTFNARDIAELVRLPLPVVSKLLKLLSKNRFLTSQRGTKGGYALACHPREITVAAIIRAVEGPIAVTECTDKSRDCDLEPECPVRANWQLINQAIQSALEKITLAEMTQPLHQPLVSLALTEPPFRVQ